MNDSKQKVIGRNNPPRVHITYEREENGASYEYEIPCVIGILADLSNIRSSKIKEYEKRDFVEITKDNYENIIQNIQPTIEIDITIKEVTIKQTLTFSSLKDFHPLKIIEKVPELNKTMQQVSQLKELIIKILNNNKIYKAFESFLAATDKVNWEFFNEHQKKELLSLFKDVTSTNKIDNKNIIKSSENIYNSMNEKISKYLDAILHDKKFQQLESTWLGISYVLTNLDSSTIVRVLNTTKDEIFNDLTTAKEVDRSYLFQKIYEKEYGTLGGKPYSFLLADFYVNSSSDDVRLLKLLSQTMSCSHSPICVGVDSSMFDISTYENLYDFKSLKDVFKLSNKTEFNGFRETEDSRYLSLVMPRFMGRIPYGTHTHKTDRLNYLETIEKHEDFLWTNAVYAYGKTLGESFQKYGWFSACVGIENGGVIDDLPIYNYNSELGDTIIKCPTEVAITDRRELELSDNGFISLCHSKDNNFAVFFSGQSAQKPVRFADPIANSSSKLSSSFNNILNISRIAQYCKYIIRNKIGKMSNDAQISNYLNIWISRYIITNEPAPEHLKIKYPLRQALITVNDNPYEPGWYKAVIHLVPHSYLQGVEMSIRMVTKIPKQINFTQGDNK